jgi:hypothetical protein
VSKQTAKKFFVGLGIVGALGLAADVFGLVNFLTASPAPMPDTSPDPEPPGTDAPSSDDSEPAPSAPQLTYVAQLSADHVDDQSSTGSADSDLGHINGHLYGHSIIMDPGCQNDDGGDMWAEYDLGRKYRSLRVTVGSSEKDPADSKFRYTILGDGVKLASGSVTKLRTANLNVDVQGHLTLRLMISDPRAPERTCGFSNHYRFVWGDALLLP